MKYVIREGKKRGRGAYVASTPIFNDLTFFYTTRKQRRATRFDTYEAARRIVDSDRLITGLKAIKYRVVKLKERA